MPPLPPGETSLITLRLRGTLPAATARELQAVLAAAQAMGLCHHHARKQVFGRFDAVLDAMPTGPHYLENEVIAEKLAGELAMLAELGFVVHGFAILPNHAHAVLHLPARSNLNFAKALDLLHQRTEAACRRLVRPQLPPEAPFWQPGWHEVPLADADELTRALAYLRRQTHYERLTERYQTWPYVFN
ncbi:MAG: hypothetical protein ACRYFK_15780 [Janthinobacterium lividum]